MQQQRRVYAQHNPGAVADVLPEVLSDDSDIVNFLLRTLPKQNQLMSALRENSETIEVDVDLMEWIDQDYESEHHAAAAIAEVIIFNFPRFYKSLSVACEYLRSALSMDQLMKPVHSSQLRCSMNLPEAFFDSNPNLGERRIRILRGRLAAVQNEKQIVKSRTFACTNDNCRFFSKAVTHVFCFLDDVEGTSPIQSTQTPTPQNSSSIRMPPFCLRQLWNNLYGRRYFSM
jgi:hypothetical protein